MTVGKDTKNQFWFQSEHFLVNVSKAVEFYVEKGLFWSKKWYLYAKVPRIDPGGNEYLGSKLIGMYRTELEATMGLSQARKALGITLLDQSYFDEIEKLSGQ
jgi:hypothetical protein